MAKQNVKKKSTSLTGETAAAGAITAGVAGLLLAAWLLYGTASRDPFRWGVFAEELIAALCALFAIRLVCVIRLPKWVPVACIILLPAAVALYGARFLPGDIARFERALCLAAASAFALLTAHRLDAKPDGTLAAALLAAFCVPVLLEGQTRLLDELMRAALGAGIFFSVLSVRNKAAGLLYLAAAAFTAAGAAGYTAAFAGAGAGIGALLFAPRRNRGSWVFAAILMGVLPIAALFTAHAFLPEGSPLLAANTQPAGAFAALIQPHLLRALALGLAAMSVRFLFGREDAAVPAALALAGCAVARLLPFAAAPDIWMDAMPLAALAGVGVAKVARGNTR